MKPSHFQLVVRSFVEAMVPILLNHKCVMEHRYIHL